MLDNNFIICIIAKCKLFPLGFLPKVVHFHWNKIDEITMEENYDKPMTYDMKTVVFICAKLTVYALYQHLQALSRYFFSHLHEVEHN